MGMGEVVDYRQKVREMMTGLKEKYGFDELAVKYFMTDKKGRRLYQIRAMKWIREGKVDTPYSLYGMIDDEEVERLKGGDTFWLEEQMNKMAMRFAEVKGGR